MTLKEMMKKVEIYNELAEQFDTSKQVVELSCEHEWVKLSTWKEAQKYIKKEYTDEYAAAVLSHTGFEFNKETTINYCMNFGAFGKEERTATVCTLTFPM